MRRRRTIAAVAATGVALGGATAVWALALRGHGTHALLPLPAVIRTPVPTPVVTPSSIDYVVPVSVSFPDARNGWVLGSGCDAQQRCTVSVARTADGGAHWTLSAPPVPPTVDAFALRITAAGPEDAMVWGDLDTGRGLSMLTRDGGRTWLQVADGGGATTGVVVDAGWYWRLKRCDVAEPPQPCLELVRIPVVPGQTWRATNPPPAEVSGPLYDQEQVVGPELVRRGRRLWILDGDWLHQGLARSDDGGTSWTTLTVPCSRSTTMMSASSETHVVLACVRIGAWPAPQEVWTSDDGGDHWTLRSRSGDDPGHVYSRGAPVAVVALDADTIWMPDIREDTLVSHDGGATWAHAPLPEGFGPAGGAQGLTFADALHGWIWGAAGLWATADGGRHWTSQPVIGAVPH